MFPLRRPLLVLSVALATGLLCAASKPPAPATYTLAQLKVPAGFTGASASAVNDFGQVVGSVSSATANHAVVWATATALPTDLNNGYNSSSASAINTLGQIVGTCRDGSEDRPVIWVPGSNGYVMTDLAGDDPSVGYGYATDINSSGEVLGYLYAIMDGYPWPDGLWGFVVVPEDTNGDDFPDCWFRDADGDGRNDLMILFQVSMEMMWTYEASAINDLGWVVGTCDPGWAYDPQEAFVIIPDYTLPNPWYTDADNDGFNDLAMLTGGYPFIEDINNQGQFVAAGLFKIGVDGAITPTALPPTSTYSWSLPRGINDNGQVVGTGRTLKGKTDYDPLLWQPDKGTMQLKSLVSSMAGFSDLDGGAAINNHGQIVGTGTTSAGKRAYLATPIGN
jgi:uncharacterized membrane protein